MTDTITAEPSAPSSLEEVTSRSETVGYVRSPSDVLRIVVFGVLTILTFAASRYATDAITGSEEAVVNLLGFLNRTAIRVLAGSAQVLSLVLGIFVFVIPLLLRRFRLVAYVVVGNVVCWALTSAAVWWLDKNTSSIVNDIADKGDLNLHGVLTPATLAQVASSFVILAPFVTRRWRQAGAITITVMTLLRLVIVGTLPAHVLLALSIGALVGSAVLYAFGRPDQRPTMATVRLGLQTSGLPIASLERASVDARGSVPYFASLTDGSRVFAKALSPEERSADLLFRMYRYLRFKNVGDERPFSSLRRTVEHEALVALQARDVGVRTPRMRAIADLGGDSMLLAYDMIDGKSLDRIPDEDVSDEFLRALWEQVTVLRTHRIAHRDLRRANVFVDGTGDPWIIDFGFSEVAAGDGLLAADVAQLLAALSIKVGAARAVDSAVGVLGAEEVGKALPRLQKAALSGATQAALKERPGLLKEVQQTVADRAGIDQIEFEDIARVRGKTVFTIIMLAAVTYFLVPQLADLPGVFDRIKEANWSWFPLVLLMSVFTYMGAAVSFFGAVPGRIPLVPTFLTQVGSSFVSKLAPAGLGGMGLNIRYLQKQGVDPAVGASSVGLNSVGGFVMHMILLVVFAVWAGRSVFDAVKLPDPKYFVFGAIAVVVLAIVFFAIPQFRKLFVTKLVPILKRSLGGLAAVLHKPGKLVLLLLGSTIVTMSYVFSLYFAGKAFGSDLSLVELAAVYLLGSTVAAAAPTPGGLGAMEAALIAGMVAAGVPNTIAVPSVFMYRFATFWLPILPGWGCFTFLQRREYI